MAILPKAKKICNLDLFGDCPPTLLTDVLAIDFSSDFSRQVAAESAILGGVETRRARHDQVSLQGRVRYPILFDLALPLNDRTIIRRWTRKVRARHGVCEGGEGAALVRIPTGFDRGGPNALAKRLMSPCSCKSSL